MSCLLGAVLHRWRCAQQLWALGTEETCALQRRLLACGLTRPGGFLSVSCLLYTNWHFAVLALPTPAGTHHRAWGAGGRLGRSSWVRVVWGYGLHPDVWSDTAVRAQLSLASQPLLCVRVVFVFLQLASQLGRPAVSAPLARLVVSPGGMCCCCRSLSTRLGAVDTVRHCLPGALAGKH